MDSLLASCFTVQKMYGRAPESMETVIEVFHSLLAKYPAGKVLKAMETWIERSQEFPTVADIVGLIQRNGRPPVSKEIYVAISKKDGADRTAEDWQYMRDYEAEQRGEAWKDDEIESALKAKDWEINQLQFEVQRLQAEIGRIGKELREERAKQGLVLPEIATEEKIRRTAAFMRANGADELEVMDFVDSTREQLAG